MTLLFNNLNLFDNDGINGNVVVPAAAEGSGVCDRVDDLKTLDNLTEARILCVKVRSILVHNEELGGSGVGVAGSRHGENAASVTEVVGHKAVCHKLALDACRLLLVEVCIKAAALDHKALDYAVEDKSCEEARLNQVKEVLNGYGSLLGVKLGDHFAVVLNCEFDLGMIHFWVSFQNM